jgi:ribosomal protein S18 acetylase RimI-like enzyme
MLAAYLFRDRIFPMLIRRYQAPDNVSIKALHYAGLAQFGAVTDPYHDNDLNDIEGTYINNGGEFLVGTRNEEIIAMGALKRISADRAEIKRVRVRQDCQRRGYGETILLRLIELAVKTGFKELCLDSVVDNVPAQRLFDKCGFTEIRRGKVGKYDLVFYTKKLNE